MKLTDEQRNDLMSEVIDYAEALERSWQTERESRYALTERESRYALVAAVENLMAAAYEAGKADQRAQKDCDTCPDCGAEGLSSCIC